MEICSVSYKDLCFNSNFSMLFVPANIPNCLLLYPKAVAVWLTAGQGFSENKWQAGSDVKQRKKHCGRCSQEESSGGSRLSPIQCTYNAHTVLWQCSIKFTSRQEKVRPKQRSPIRKFSVDHWPIASAICLSILSCIYGNVFVLWVCPWAQIYPTPDKAQSPLKLKTEI